MAQIAPNAVAEAAEAADAAEAAEAVGSAGSAEAEAADAERRFGGLRRLHGEAGYARLRSAAVAVVGLGGVGSWAAEALARSGVARLVLIDLDHVAESNINRQVQATSATLGQHKGLALRERIAGIHPGCEVEVVDAFVEPANWPGLLPRPVDLLIDACDQSRAKRALVAWGLATATPVITVGAAGGKRQAQRVEVEDLASVTHDPLLAGLRQRLRQDGVAPRQGPMGVRCVFSRETVLGATGAALVGGAAGAAGARAPAGDGTLNCQGYGSSVTVTATFGMVAAGAAIELLCAAPAGADACHAPDIL